MAEQSAPPLKKQRREGPETSSDDEEEESDQTKSKPFRVEKVSNIRNRKFNVEEIRFRAKFTEELHDERLLDATDDLQDMFAEILETIDNEGYLDEDRVRISINHEGLERPVFIHCQPRHHVTVDAIMQRFGAVLQSNQTLNADSTFDVEVGVMKRNEYGGGRRSAPVLSVGGSTSLDVDSKRSMVRIAAIPGEYMCCARAIAVCLSKIRDNTTEYAKVRNIRNANSNQIGFQKDRALKLHRNAGVTTDSPVQVRELFKFEESEDIQIVVVSGDFNNEIIYTGISPREIKIFLYLKDEHFHAITDINGFFPKKKFCVECLQTYGAQVKQHFCKAICPTCNRKNCSYSGEGFSCTSCNMYCRGKECYDSHKKNREFKNGPKKGEAKPSLCNSIYKCIDCSKILDITRRRKDSHRCGEYFCKCCETYVIGKHLCYYRIKSPAKTSGKFLFFDFECSQDKFISCKKGYQNDPKPQCPDCQPNHLCSSCRRCVNCKRSYCGLAEHIPNFVVVQSACDRCKYEICSPNSKCLFCGDVCSKCLNSLKRKEECDSAAVSIPSANRCYSPECGKREIIFSGQETLERFCQWLVKPARKGFTCLAHNGKGYDFLFLVKYFTANGIFPEVVYSGAKIMTMKLSQNVGLRFVDSLNFLPMALKKLPEALNLRSELKKGDFPHLFNTQANFDYVGPYPASSYYGLEKMSSEARKEFLEWHAGQAGKIFHFKNEILAYARSDVEILREACMKFRDLIMDVTRGQQGQDPVDPFAHATIASSAMQYIRQHCLKEEHRVTLTDGRKGRAFLKAGVWFFEGGHVIPKELIVSSTFVKSDIPQLPINGYEPHFNQSRTAIAWLEWISQKEGVSIQHARNGGEFLIPGTSFHADGFCLKQNKIFEFAGCRWHGHTCMASRDAKDPKTGLTMKELYRRTLNRLKQISDKGYQVECMWECEFKRLVKEDPNLANFLETYKEPQPPLHIRSAFYGGRTSPVKLFHEANDDEEIRYFDVTSLYPYINLVSRYPSSHPVILKDNFDYTLDPYFGIIQCKVLPPTDLFIPVLPYRAKGRLKFPLCASCSEAEKNRQCHCEDTQRALVGTWTTEELKVALKNGYKIIEIFSVYHFPETIQGDQGYFYQYVSKFLKLKQESSGFPYWVKTQEDEEKYIAHYKEKQGILLDKKRIEKNPSLRFVAKLYLNSAWGKFAQATNQSKCLFVHDKGEYERLRNDPTKDITNFHIINEDVIALEMKCDSDFLEENTFENETIGIFTTSNARLHLFKILEKTGKNTLYFDTDSVIFIQNKSADEILHTGDLLGELTDELPPGTHIKLFMSSGPKCYSYLTSDEQWTMKVKGITLNHANKAVLDPDKMRQVVLGSLETVQLPPSERFARDKYRGIVYNCPSTKKYRKVFTKRVMIPNSFESVPFGYKF